MNHSKVQGFNDFSRAFLTAGMNAIDNNTEMAKAAIDEMLFDDGETISKGELGNSQCVTSS